ncbi:hypothetical protein [Pelagicoccus sp. SDUM812003]|uniref:hypothetical protein n=1 Tax=Pelagicoccus sp. SDUM812003 TaxID=3041267 RepID=UPI00280D6705|nr:hypothetical protein [Pelagicoccus sp. SDUM812003]MDQ8202943.1 hypothetical protein [Pelagicoccus sp. SDUM812003]
MRIAAPFFALVAGAGFALLVPQIVRSEVLFSDDFESFELGKAWTYQDEGGRYWIADFSLDEYRSKWLVLDTEAAGAYVENKLSVDVVVKGRDRVEVSSDCFSLGEGGPVFTGAPDAILLSVDGGLERSIVWLSDFWPNDSGKRQVRYSFRMTEAVPDYDPTKEYRLTFSLLQSDDEPWPRGGWAFDYFQVEAHHAEGVFFYHPQSVGEAESAFEVEVKEARPPEAAARYQFYFEGRLQGEGVYPAGADAATFAVSIEDDAVVNGEEVRTYVVKRDGVEIEELSVWSLDDEDLSVRFDFPDSVDEGETVVGRVSVYPAFENDVMVRLVSATEDRIASEWVKLRAGDAEVDVALQATENGDINLDEAVQMTFEVGGRNANVAIRVVDNDEYRLRLVDYQGSRYAEGDSLQAALSLGANALEDVVVELSSDYEGLIEFPAEVVISQGTSRSTQFEIRFPENNDRTGATVLNLVAQARGLSEAGRVRAQFTVLDNEASGFAVHFGPMLEEGVEYGLMVQALDFEGELENNYNSTVSVSLLAADGTRKALGSGQVGMAGGGMTLWLVATAEMNGARVLVEGPNDEVGMTLEPLRVWSGYDLHLSGDAVYNPNSGTLFATLGANAAEPWANSFAEIDPSNGEIKRYLSLGEDSNAYRLAVSSDFKKAFVALNGRFSLARIDLERWELETEFEMATGSSASGQSEYEKRFVAWRLFCPEGRPNDVIVSQSEAGTSAYETVYYRDGSPGVSEVGHPDMLLLVQGEDDSHLYSVDGFSSSRRINRIALGESDFQIEESLETGPLEDYQGDALRAGDKLFGLGGRIARLPDLSLEGVFEGLGDVATNPSDFAVDSSSNRALFVLKNSIWVYDLESYRRVADLLFRSDGDVPSRVILLDEGRFCLITETGKLVVFDDPRLLPRGEEGDVSARLLSQSGRAQIGEPFEIRFEVANGSQQVARNVRVLVTTEGRLLPHGVDVEEASVAIDLDRGIELGFDALEAGESREVSLRLTPVDLAAFEVRIWALSENVDTVSSNDQLVVSGQGSKTLKLNEWVEIPHAIKKARWNPLRRKLVGYTNYEEDYTVGKWTSVREVDPYTSETRRVASFDEPIVGMQISEDGESVLIGFSGPARIVRLDLESGQATEVLAQDLDGALEFGLSGFLVLDESQRDCVFVGERRIARSRNGAILPSTIDVFSGEFEDVFVDEAGQRIYYLRGNSPHCYVGRLELVEDGVRKAEPFEREIGRYENRIDLVGDVVVGAQGSRVATESMNVLGPLAIDESGLSDVSYQGQFTDVLYEESKRRLYFSDKRSVVSYDSVRGREIRRLALPDLAEEIVGLERWGEDGLALSLTNGRILVGRFDIVPMGCWPFDLVIDNLDTSELSTNGAVSIDGRVFAPDPISTIRLGGEELVFSGEENRWSDSIDGLEAGRYRIVVQAISEAEEDAKLLHFFDILAPTDLDRDEDGILDTWELERFPGKDLISIAPDADAGEDDLDLRMEFLLGGNESRFDNPFQLSLEETEDAGCLSVQVRIPAEEGFRPYFEWLNVESGERFPALLQRIDSVDADGYETFRMDAPFSEGHEIWRLQAEAIGAAVLER